MKNQKEVQVIGILDVQRRIIPVKAFRSCLIAIWGAVWR